MKTLNRFLFLLGALIVAAIPLRGVSAGDESVPPDRLRITEWDLPTSFSGSDQVLRGRVRLISPASSGDLNLCLSLNGAPVASASVFYGARPPSWARSDARWIDFEIRLPGDLPEGSYQLNATDVSGLEITGMIGKRVDCGIVPELPPAGLLSVEGQGLLWEVSLSRPLDEATSLEVWFLTGADHSVLQAAANYEVYPGTGLVKVELPKDGRWNGVQEGALDFHLGGQNYLSTRVSVQLPKLDKAKPVLDKPMAHGVYREHNGVQHYWWADDSFMLWWNGEPWLPEGGMYCPYTKMLVEHTFEARQQYWSEIIESLDTLQAAGFKDLYVNAQVGLTQPKWNVQKLVNEFNDRGLRFGWQLTTGAKPFYAYSIRSSASQGLIKGLCEQAGVLQVSLPRVSIDSLLLIPSDGNGNARRVSFSWEEGVTTKAGLEIAQILKSEKSAAGEAVQFEVPGLATGEYYVIVDALENGKRLSDVWGRLEETRMGLDWVSDIDWGEGLRFFVDPICNEGGFNNRYEAARVSSDAFNRDFSRLLSEQYEGSLDRLTAEWQLPEGSLQDFDQAARLIPLRDQDESKFQDEMWLADPLTGDVYKTEGGVGNAWMDYLKLVRVSYADKRDEIARYLKDKVQVPVVYKRVAPWTALEGISRALDGFDGVGLELYPEGGSVLPYGALPGRMEAELAPHTVWLLATELGYSAKPENRGIESWPDEESLYRAVSDTYGVGAKGVFLFGWRLPNQLWQNHALLGQPERLKWVRNVFERIREEPNLEWSAFGQVFPEGQSWWWRAGKKLWTRYNSVYDGPPSAFIQSLFLADRENGDSLWGISTSVPVSGFEPVIVNLSDAFYAEYYSEDLKQLHKDGNRMIYLGLWPEGADEPAFLSRHFKSRQILPKSGGGHCQPLQLFPGDEVLAEDAQGNVWAKLADDGKLLIVAAEPIVPPTKNAAIPSPVLDSKWVEALMGE